MMPDDLRPLRLDYEERRPTWPPAAGVALVGLCFILAALILYIFK